MKKFQPKKIRNRTKRKIALVLYRYTYGQPIPAVWRKPGRLEREVLAVLESR